MLQEFWAILVAICFLVMHVRLWPYKHIEDNLVKTLVEIQIVSTILICLLSKGGLDIAAEERFYDYFLCALFDGTVLAFVFAILWKIWILKERLGYGDLDDSVQDAESENIKSLIMLHSCGVAGEGECDQLCVYFTSLITAAKHDLIKLTVEGSYRRSDQPARGSEVPVRSLIDGSELHAGTADSPLNKSEKPTQPGVTEPADKVRKDYYSKFDAGFAGSFASLHVFHAGLESLVGECRKDIFAAMIDEHCCVVDGFAVSRSSFTTSNYSVTTTPADEFAFVHDESFTERMPAGTDPATRHSRGFRTKVSPHDLLRGAAALISQSFMASGFATSVTQEQIDRLPLLLEEVISLRLYTGVHHRVFCAGFPLSHFA